MNRYSVMMLGAAIACGCAFAQTENPLSTEVKGSYTNVKNNILKAADKVSEADYAFKATPDVRPFGQLLGHVADANLRTCSTLNSLPARASMRKPSRSTDSPTWGT